MKAPLGEPPPPLISSGAVCGRVLWQAVQTDDGQEGNVTTDFFVLWQAFCGRHLWQASWTDLGQILHRSCTDLGQILDRKGGRTKTARGEKKRATR